MSQTTIHLDNALRPDSFSVDDKDGTVIVTYLTNMTMSDYEKLVSEDPHQHIVDVSISHQYVDNQPARMTFLDDYNDDVSLSITTTADVPQALTGVSLTFPAVDTNY